MAGESSPAALACLAERWTSFARRRAVLAFIEVKARRTSEAAAMSLDAWRLRRVVVAAERLTPRYLRPGDDVRIDAIFIVRGDSRIICRTSGMGDKVLSLA
jgi:Holliday junction resolvase-like predicted endonuclease